MLWHLCIPLFCHGVASVPPFSLQARHEFPAIRQSGDQEIQRTEIRQSRDQEIQRTEIRQSRGHGIRRWYIRISRYQKISDQREVGDAGLLIKAQGRCWQCVQAWDCLKTAIQASRGCIQQDWGCLGAGEGAGVSADMTDTTGMTDMTVPASPPLSAKLTVPAPPLGGELTVLPPPPSAELTVLPPPPPPSA